ncbi:hypothetical protein [Bosea sp. (in: a-proteobacteria)]|uniref:hypothetical protein n=1 Tax=Bosea sp. (in: a-proteobacteria) TaxID=1871050 RepID=UPI001ACAE23F|nr:hypothetical protein [Bosea sp. (in: a-proteobacteria)]MBN9437141.1 hypothetical protein [Bosea sp. (in: a-proteobacteria)]
MATSKRRSHAGRAETQAQTIVSKMITMQADAGLTIAMRLPILLQGALGDARGQREASKAVVEKVSAVMESSFAIGHAATLFWLNMAVTPLTPRGLGEAAAKAAHNTLEPFSKRTRANASRLSGRRG